MKILFKESFYKVLNRIRDPIVLKNIKFIIESIKLENNISNIGNIIKLTGYRNYFRIRSGKYRVGIRIDDDSVTFVRILHRKDIYRYFPIL